MILESVMATMVVIVCAISARSAVVVARRQVIAGEQDPKEGCAGQPPLQRQVVMARWYCDGDERLYARWLPTAQIEENARGLSYHNDEQYDLWRQCR
jgi:hypothetical protein